MSWGNSGSSGGVSMAAGFFSPDVASSPSVELAPVETTRPLKNSNADSTHLSCFVIPLSFPGQKNDDILRRKTGMRLRLLQESKVRARGKCPRQIEDTLYLYT